MLRCRRTRSEATSTSTPVSRRPRRYLTVQAYVHSAGLKIVAIMSRTADPQHRPLRTALTERVVIADGAMGSMLQGSSATLDDFAGHEGCNEILNATRPDIVRSVHDGYLAAGVDAISTNTFGANLGNLGEYGISDRIYELSLAGATIARQAADDAAADGRPRWVLGSIRPGTKPPTDRKST